MSKENIGKFLDALMTDKTLAEKVASLAKENGCDFTAEELLEIGAARPLDDEDMMAVSGGVSGKEKISKLIIQGLENRWR